jgi:hypothetical protein
MMNSMRMRPLISGILNEQDPRRKIITRKRQRIRASKGNGYISTLFAPLNSGELKEPPQTWPGNIHLIEYLFSISR